MYRPLIFILLFGLSSSAFAQDWDFGTWHRVKASGGLTKKLSLSIEQQLRMHENSTRVDQTFTELGLGYDLPKGFALNAAYRFSWSHGSDGAFSNRHRYNIDINYGKKFWLLKAKARARFQHRPSAYLVNERLEPQESPVFVRLKLALDFTPIKKWTPGIAFESFFRVASAVDDGATKFRYRAYLNYDLPKRQELGLFYMIETDYSGTTPEFASVLGINFSYEWKRPKKKKKKDKK
ncbi:MAG: DUF2490 domain-containing protein [Flavobacteriales bacterium]